MDDDLDSQITCATYTHARRHPMVMGNIGGWTPPFQVTMPQLAVLVVTYFIELWTWRWWAALLPRVIAIMLAISLPCLLAWAVRRTRLEGRSLPRTLLGWLMLMWTPRMGQVGGRPNRPAPLCAPLRAGIYVAPGEEML